MLSLRVELEEGYEAVIASPKKKVLKTVVHDFEGWDTYTEKPGYPLESHIFFEQVVPTEYDGLIIPGGRAPKYIRLDENIPRIASHFFETGKPVGVICHAVNLQLILFLANAPTCTANLQQKSSVAS